jgi:long-chain fatty acid transport protein
MRDYTVTGAPTGSPGTVGLFPGTVESENELFLIPNFGRNWMLSNDSSIGVTIYGNGGMNTQWDADDVDPFGFGTFGSGTAGVDLSQLFINTTYARKINPTVSWGISGIVAFQVFEAKGIASFAGVSNDPANLTNNGHDDSFGFGVKAGISGEVAPNFSLGASYQSEIKMEEFDDYAGLFAEQGDFDIPSTFTVGLAYENTPNSAVLFDIQRINYGGIKSIHNPILPNFGICATRMTPTSPSCLGGSDGIGFGWEDVTVYRIGYQWTTGNDWTWRVGFSTVDQPIPDSEVLFNILAPGVVEEHFTGGFSKDLGNNSALDVSFMYAPSVSVSGPNPLEAPGAQEIELEMKQFAASVNWSKRF